MHNAIQLSKNGLNGASMVSTGGKLWDEKPSHPSSGIKTRNLSSLSYKESPHHAALLSYTAIPIRH